MSERTAETTVPPAGHGLSAAICHRCGGTKKGPFVPCKACGYTPVGEERQVAWLFSEHHLDAAELIEAAQRIVQGERPDPPKALLDDARVQMGAGPLTDDGRRPLTPAQLLGLGAADLLLTPLVGLAVWWGMRDERPVAAKQALRITVPIALVVAVTWVSLIGSWRLG